MSSILRATCAALLLAVPAALRGQTVGGQVVDPVTRRPARATGAALLNDSVRFAATARVDSATGIFYLNAPRPGVYQVILFDRRGRASISDTVRLDADSTVERAFPLPVSDSSGAAPIYFPSEVTKPATPRPRNQQPAFPDELRRKGQPGLVAMAFVVDAEGRVDPQSITTIAASHAAFGDAVRKILPKFRFVPAELDGRPVRQIQQYTFGFAFPGQDLPADVIVMALGVEREKR